MQKTHLLKLIGSPPPLNLVLTPGITALYKCVYLLTYLLLNFKQKRMKAMDLATTPGLVEHQARTMTKQ